MIRTMAMIFGMLLVVAGQARADTLYLKNGRSIKGIIVAETSERLELDIGFGKVGFRQSEIARIERSDAQGKDLLRAKWEQDRQEREKRLEEEKLREAAKPKSVALSQDHGQIVVAALLNNSVPVSLVLDTGASFIVLTREVAEKIGMPETGKNPRIAMRLADGRESPAVALMLSSVRVEDVEAKNVEAVIIEDRIDDPSMRDGLLGMSFLKHFNFKIDQKEKRLVLEPL